MPPSSSDWQRRGADVRARSTVWHQLENTAGNTNPSGNFKMAHGGSTALLFVARNGDIVTARALIDAGADVDDTAAAGTSALVIAAHSGHGPLGIFLLEAGADPNQAEAGYTALHAAVLRSQVELVASLVDHGADIDALVEHGTPGRRFSGDFSLRHQYVGANALWLAARYGEPGDCPPAHRCWRRRVQRAGKRDDHYTGRHGDAGQHGPRTAATRSMSRRRWTWPTKRRWSST